MINHIYVVYNPISTGPSRTNAEQFVNDIKDSNLPAKVELLATDYAGHLIKLAEELAADDTMIVASGGDGSYNELINGVLKSSHPSTIVGLLPSGNANDHYNFRHHGDTIERIKQFDVDEVDVLRVEWGDQVRYAHSYVGIGLTATIGRSLTKEDLNPIKEIWLVINRLFKKTPVKITVDGRRRNYDSLIFSIVGQMSKYFSISGRSETNTGNFDIIRMRPQTIIGTFKWIARHIIKPIEPTNRAAEFSFQTRHKTWIQLDGEAIRLDKNESVRVSCQSGELRCII